MSIHSLKDRLHSSLIRNCTVAAAREQVCVWFCCVMWGFLLLVCCFFNLVLLFAMRKVLSQ